MNSRITRITFIPPAVEPAQPPAVLSRISNTGRKDGHRWYSEVMKPVVVTTDMQAGYFCRFHPHMKARLKIEKG